MADGSVLPDIDKQKNRIDSYTREKDAHLRAQNSNQALAARFGFLSNQLSSVAREGQIAEKTLTILHHQRAAAAAQSAVAYSASGRAQVTSLISSAAKAIGTSEAGDVIAGKVLVSKLKDMEDNTNYQISEANEEANSNKFSLDVQKREADEQKRQFQSGLDQTKKLQQDAAAERKRESDRENAFDKKKFEYQKDQDKKNLALQEKYHKEALAQQKYANYEAERASHHHGGLFG